jgi:hypothetical protein
MNFLSYRKKKKDKEKKKLEQRIPKVMEMAKESDGDSHDGTESASSSSGRRYTKAELAFKTQQEKMVII